MAKISIHGGLLIPPFMGATSVPSYGSTQTIDASTERTAMIFQIPETGTIDTVEFGVTTVAINASSVVRISFQDVSLTTGDPDGTQDQYRDIAGSGISSNAWIQPGLITSDGTDTGSKRSVTRGDLLSVVIEYQTFTAADSIIVKSWSATGGALVGNTYCDLYTGTWAKHASLTPVMALKYNDGVYRTVTPHVGPWKAVNTATFNSGSTPDERGLKFSLPAPATLQGALVAGALTGSGGATVKVYDSDGSTVLGSYALDDAVKRATGGYQFYAQFADIDLNANTSYRVTVLPDSATSVNLYDGDVHSAAIMDAVAGGQNWHYTQRTDAGAWTDTTTKRPFIGLILNKIDDGASCSGRNRLLMGVGAMAAAAAYTPAVSSTRRDLFKTLATLPFLKWLH